MAKVEPRWDPGGAERRGEGPGLEKAHGAAPELPSRVSTPQAWQGCAPSREDSPGSCRMTGLKVTQSQEQEPRKAGRRVQGRGEGGSCRAGARARRAWGGRAGATRPPQSLPAVTNGTPSVLADINASDHPSLTH